MKKLYTLFIIPFMYTHLIAQVRDFHASVNLEGILTTQQYVPFWFRSDQFGSIPLPGASASLIGAVRKDYDLSKKHLADWGASLEVRGDLGQKAQGSLIEGYVKFRLSIFELKGGRVKEIMGLVDTSLSSGAFSVSGNALGIPKVQLSIPEYYRLPFLGGLFSLKGNFAYGWFGQIPIQTGHHVDHAETYFSQVSFYGKIGKPSWKFILEGGLNHQVFWGSEKSILGNQFGLSPWTAYQYVLLGKAYHGSKIGNHLGSLDLAATYDLKKIKIMLYRQNFYDEGALYHLANLRDGLNGLSITNKQQSIHKVKWHKLLIEVFYSKDQAGYPWSKPTPSGDENYYNNYEYTEGWSYKGVGLGSPFITPRTTTRAGFPDAPTDYFNNNRVVAFYSGIQGSVMSWLFTGRLSYSMNYGTFETSPWGRSTGSSRNAPVDGLFKETNQFSGFIEVNKPMKHGLNLGFAAAIDNGGLFYHSYGFITKLKKSF